MAQVLKVSATEFARGFARYREEAFSNDVIEVTSHGRVIGGYLGTVFGWGEVTRFDLRSVLIATLGSAVLLLFFRLIRGGR